jgi:WD40 repeat protein
MSTNDVRRRLVAGLLSLIFLAVVSPSPPGSCASCEARARSASLLDTEDIVQDQDAVGFHSSGVPTVDKDSGGNCPNTVTFQNQVGTAAVVKLVGPSRPMVDIGDGHSLAVSVPPGAYYVLARYGRSAGEYVYSKSVAFTVTRGATQPSAVKVTLHKPPGNDAGARQEFELLESRGAYGEPCVSRKQVFSGDEESTGEAVFSPDGKLMAIELVSSRGMLLWDTVGNRKRSALGDVSAHNFVFSPDGEQLAAWWQTELPCTDIVVWDVETGRALRDLKVPNVFTTSGGHEYAKEFLESRQFRCGDLAFSPDGRWLASGRAYSPVPNGPRAAVVTLWDVKKGRPTGEFSLDQFMPPNALAFTPDGDRLVSAGSRFFRRSEEDSPVRLWEIEYGGRGTRLSATGRNRVLVSGPRSWGILTPNGRWAGGIDESSRISTWDVATGRISGTLSLSAPKVFELDRLIMSGDGRWVAVKFRGEYLSSLWSVASGQEVLDFQGRYPLAFSLDGHWLALGTEQGLELWEFQQVGQPQGSPGH